MLKCFFLIFSAFFISVFGTLLIFFIILCVEITKVSVFSVLFQNARNLYCIPLYFVLNSQILSFSFLNNFGLLIISSCRYYNRFFFLGLSSNFSKNSIVCSRNITSNLVFIITYCTIKIRKCFVI